MEVKTLDLVPLILAKSGPEPSWTDDDFASETPTIDQALELAHVHEWFERIGMHPDLPWVAEETAIAWAAQAVRFADEVQLELGLECPVSDQEALIENTILQLSRVPLHTTVVYAFIPAILGKRSRGFEYQCFWRTGITIRPAPAMRPELENGAIRQSKGGWDARQTD